jgi:Carboxypeptidase regulatory-like domain
MPPDAVAGEPVDDRRGSIRGVVLTEHGEPVEGATVIITAGPPHQDLAALTTDDGRFELAGLLPGTYSLLVTSPTGKQQALQTSVLPGQASMVEVRIGTG